MIRFQVMLASLFVLGCSAFVKADAVMAVSWRGKKAGELTALGPGAGHHEEGGAHYGSGFIAAHFAKTGIEPGVEAQLQADFPEGLTYLQTGSYWFENGSQQRIFRDKDGDNLVGAFSDCPQYGYTLPNGARQFAADETPWYVNIAPSGTAGALPQLYQWQTPAGPIQAQMYDFAKIPFEDQPNGIKGLADLLACQDGALTFETWLVGVRSIPANKITGTYTVAPLAGFLWELKFEHTGTGQPGSTESVWSDYTVTSNFDPIAGGPLSYSTAFDRQGDNADVEWKISFIPEPMTVALLWVGGVAMMRRRSRASDAGGRAS